ncbi:MAG: MBL fold metallo-hydrolase [Bacteroidota bacterium]
MVDFASPFKHTVFLFLLFFSLGETPVWSQTEPNTHKDFKIEKLSDGIYAAIHKTGGHAICNAGIIDLGGATLVIDPFLSPSAALELKKAAMELTGNAVKYVVNTHYHNDHVRGNQVFPEATIICSEKTRELMKINGPLELENDRKESANQLEFWRSKTIDPNDLSAVENRKGMIGYYEGIVQSLPDIQLTMPQVIFKNSLTIEGNTRSIEVMDMGNGHTESDAVIWVESENLLFAGDLLFVNTQPWMLDGNPENWFRILDRLVDMMPEAIVPGHGPVSTIEDIAPMKAYMRTVVDAAMKLSAKPDMQIICPPPFDQWMLSAFYFPNVIGLSKRIKDIDK